MIYEFGFRNYFSFKEGASISFRKTNKNIPNKKVKPYPIMGVKGANASGKTHLIRALSFLSDFCTRSFLANPDSNLKIQSFFQTGAPSDFYIEFKSGGIDYLYELTLTEKSVLLEKLSYLENQSIIFERDENSISFANNKSEFILVKFRKNVSVMSTLQQYELIYKDVHIQNAFQFFNRIVSNVGFLGVRENILSIDDVSKLYYEDHTLFSTVKDIIIKNDLGISDIEIHAKDENGKKAYFPIFQHSYKVGKENQVANLFQYHESSGTMRLYSELWKYFLVLSQGGVLALDEFDKNLHALILPHLLNLFLDKDINKKNAQFLFTAHNTEIMDYLGKYRTVLVQKQDGESFCYRLDEIEGNMLVEGKPLSPLYLQGRLGGVPNI